MWTQAIELAVRVTNFNSWLLKVNLLKIGKIFLERIFGNFGVETK